MNFLYLRGRPLTGNMIRAGDNSVRSLPSGWLRSQPPISLPQHFPLPTAEGPPLAPPLPDPTGGQGEGGREGALGGPKTQTYVRVSELSGGGVWVMGEGLNRRLNLLEVFPSAVLAPEAQSLTADDHVSVQVS